jgi:hypothetical protein
MRATTKSLVQTAERMRSALQRSQTRWRRSCYLKVCAVRIGAAGAHDECATGMRAALHLLYLIFHIRASDGSLKRKRRRSEHRCVRLLQGGHRGIAFSLQRRLKMPKNSESSGNASGSSKLTADTGKGPSSLSTKAGSAPPSAPHSTAATRCKITLVGRGVQWGAECCKDKLNYNYCSFVQERAVGAMYLRQPAVLAAIERHAYFTRGVQTERLCDGLQAK